MIRKTLLLTTVPLAAVSLAACGAEPPDEDVTAVVQELGEQVEADIEAPGDSDPDAPPVPDVLLDPEDGADLGLTGTDTGGLDHITSCAQVAEHAGTLIDGLDLTEEEFTEGRFTCTWEVPDVDGWDQIQLLTVDGVAKDHSPFIFGPDVLEASGLTPLPHPEVEAAGGMTSLLDAGSIEVITVTIPDAEIAVSGGGLTHSRVQIDAALELAVTLLEI